jgi:putative transcriptional regulator
MPSTSTLAPGFLLAPPALRDGNFERSVVLLAAHDDEGATGFIINRTSDLRLHALLPDLDLVPTVADRAVYVGGPVQGYAGFVMYEHAPNAPAGPGTSISETVSISPSREVLELAVHGRLGGRFELLLGYAGWGPGQLEAELREGGWLHADFDVEVLFDIDADERWHEVYDRLGIAPGGVIVVPGGALA